MERGRDPAYKCNGCQGEGYRAKWPTNWRNYGNQTQVGALDIQSARAIKADEAAQRYDRFYAVIGDNVLPNWDQLLETYPVAEAREMYHSSQAIKLLRENDEFRWADVDEYLCSREDYIRIAANKTYATFAFIRDGRWFDRGEMGWFGVVHDEVDKDQYYSEFAKMLDNLPKETWLTIIDCHI